LAGDRDERSALCSIRLISRDEYLAPHWIGGLVGPKARSRLFVVGKNIVNLGYNLK